MSERALLLDSINPSASEVLLTQGYRVDEFEKSVSQDTLAELARNVEILGVRSGPEVSSLVIENSDTLKAIGCFCVGTNHVDKDAAAKSGIAVFNAAHENTRSVAEHVVSSVYSLMKRMGEHNLALHNGIWTKTDEMTYEVRGKTMGIIGYGAIGSQVSVLAEAVGMNVIYFDPNPQYPPYGRARRIATMEELLAEADVTTLHVPGGENNKNLINESILASMKPGSYLINTSRGEVMDYMAVSEALRSGQLAGIAADVFVDEPPKQGDRFNHVLRGYPNALLTPHTAGSTVEAQSDIGEKIALKLAGYVATGNSVGAVNLPSLALGSLRGDTRLLNIHQNQPSVVADITEAIAQEGHNLVAQFLNVAGNIGYVALDIEGEPSDKLKYKIGHISGVKTTRFLYDSSQAS